MKKLRDYPQNPIAGAVVVIDGKKQAIISYGGRTLWVCEPEDYWKASKEVCPLIYSSEEVLDMEVVKWM